MATKKKKSRRSSTKYPALDPTLNLKTRSHLSDYDYIDKLSEKEKQWLNDFSEGYNNANMNDRAKKIFKTDKERKDCYNANNARNRCILTKSHASGMSTSLDDLKIEERLYEEENAIIEQLDRKPDSVLEVGEVVDDRSNSRKNSNNNTKGSN